MQETYPLFYRRVLEDEGLTYTDDPDDRGGPTKCGITIADVARWYGVALPRRDGPGWADLVAKVKALTPELAGRIYKAFYWDTCNADDVPAGLDYALVDYAVNSGVGRAIPVLRRLVGAKPATKIDSDALAAIRATDVVVIINQLQDERAAFLAWLADNKAGQAKYRRGWLNRVARVRAVSVNLAQTAAKNKAEPAPVEDMRAPRAEGARPDDAVWGVTVVEPARERAPIVATVRKSTSLWALLVAAAQLVIVKFTSWADTAWDFIMWALGAMPAIVDEVSTAVHSSEQVAGWLKLDWETISIMVALAALAVVFVRHLADKRAPQ